MDPITIGTIATISMVTTAAASAVSAAGQMYQGEAQAQAARYKAGVAKVNEQIAKQNAEYSLQAGEYEAFRQGQKTRYQVGQIKAMQAGRGLDVRGGSTAAVRESQHAIGLQDQAMIRANAAKKAYGHEVEAVGARADQALYAMGEETARTGSYIGAAGSILGGVSSVASKWTQASRAGVYADGGQSMYE